MLTDGQLMQYLSDLESDRIERTVSVKDMDKFCIVAHLPRVGIARIADECRHAPQL